MINKEKEQYLLQGQLVVDFANANNSKDAFNKLVESWKKLYGGSGAVDFIRNFYLNVLDKIEHERQDADNLRLQLIHVLDSLIEGHHIDELYDLKPLGTYFEMFNEAENIRQMNLLFCGVSDDFGNWMQKIKHELPIMSLAMDRQTFGKGEHCEDIISYCLVNFLKHFKSRLKHCPYCEAFFIARDAKKKHCYSDKCERRYEQIKKQKQRKDDPETYI
jgi:hypothetical protein